jgi:nickel-dependent lactate racemase|tara:strand:+ start:1374 stop:1763 length:390 start_codon:yes stop_codon:yes gene_type:complete
VKILAEISVGELFDKITILNIKTQKIHDSEKLLNIEKELNFLNHQTSNINVKDQESLNRNIEKLQLINEELWDIENYKRECEANKDFGEKFIQLSRDVHFKNDIRAQIKKEINLLTDSTVIEEKEYSKY